MKWITTCESCKWYIERLCTCGILWSSTDLPLCQLQPCLHGCDQWRWLQEEFTEFTDCSRGMTWNDLDMSQQYGSPKYSLQTGPSCHNIFGISRHGVFCRKPERPGWGLVKPGLPGSDTYPKKSIVSPPEMCLLTKSGTSAPNFTWFFTSRNAGCWFTSKNGDWINDDWDCGFFFRWPEESLLGSWIDIGNGQKYNNSKCSTWEN